MTDYDKAITIITKVAASCVRLDGLRIPEFRERWKPIGKREANKIRRTVHKRGRDLGEALELLRRARKDGDA